MIIMHVNFIIKPDRVEAFREATLVNARETRKEPGNFRFEVLQDLSDETQFTIVEIYESKSAMDAHFETDHFRMWNRVTANMFAKAGTGAQYRMLYPQ